MAIFSGHKNFKFIFCELETRCYMYSIAGNQLLVFKNLSVQSATVVSSVTSSKVRNNSPFQQSNTSGKLAVNSLVQSIMFLK